MSLTREERDAVRAMGRRAAASLARSGGQGAGLTREFARVTKVYGDGHVDVDKGNAVHPMPMLCIPTTTACALCAVGDTVAIDTIGHVPVATGVIYTGTNYSGATKGEVSEATGQLSDQIDDLVADNVTVNGRLDALVADVYLLDTTKLSADQADILYARVGDLDAAKADIAELTAGNADILGRLTAAEADIGAIEAGSVTTDQLDAVSARVDQLDASKLTAADADLLYAKVADLDAAEADIGRLAADQAAFGSATAQRLDAAEADIDELAAGKLSATDADLRYANIDFANIGEAAVRALFSKSGIIGDLVMSDGHVTGTLVGVTIKGDLIEGGTVVADKLVIQGEDGLYYKLNATGETVSAEQTEYNSLNGSVITAKSVTAEKVSVDDLVAFGATIGGFHITDSSLYSGAKAGATNATRGVYLGDDGELAVGDSSNYLRYFKASDGTYKLEISASSISMGTKALDAYVEEKATGAVNSVRSTAVTYQAGTSGTAAPTGAWQSSVPSVAAGQYLWTRTVTTYSNGTSSTSYSVARQGQNGAKGDKGDAGEAGAKGDKGDTGAAGTSVAVSSTATSYQASTSGTTVPTGTWGSSVPSVAAGSYLWTRVVVTFSDGKTATSYSVARQGANGAKGDTGATGKGVKSAAVTYQGSTSGTTVPTGTWQSSVPSVAAGSYLWTRTVTTYTDNATTTSYSVGRMGSNGSAGRGISSTAVTYQAHSSQTSTPTGTWASSVPALSTAKPYLWTRTVVTYTDGSTSTGYSVGSTLESFEVGGTNILRDTKAFVRSAGLAITDNGALRASSADVQEETYLGLTVRKVSPVPVNSSASTYAEYFVGDLRYGDVFTMSFYAKGNASNIRAYFYGPTGYVTASVLKSSGGYSAASAFNDGNCNFAITGEWRRYWVTWKLNSSGDLSVGKYALLRCDGNTVSGAAVSVCGFKLERGNKATDWTPAPEDVDEGIEGAQNSADAAQGTASAALKQAEAAQASIQALGDSIQTLVTDANGKSLMTQTSAGWTFNMGAVQGQIQSALNGVESVRGDVSNANAAIDSLKSSVSYLDKLKPYVTISSSSGTPYIELGQEGGQFKVRITNTEMAFMQGAQKIAYLTNHQLYIQSSVVTDELRIGSGTGWVWRRRANGNLGLRQETA